MYFPSTARTIGDSKIFSHFQTRLFRTSSGTDTRRWNTEGEVPADTPSYLYQIGPRRPCGLRHREGGGLPVKIILNASIGAIKRCKYTMYCTFLNMATKYRT